MIATDNQRLQALNELLRDDLLDNENAQSLFLFIDTYDNIPAEIRVSFQEVTGKEFP